MKRLIKNLASVTCGLGISALGCGLVSPSSVQAAGFTFSSSDSLTFKARWEGVALRGVKAPIAEALITFKPNALPNPGFLPAPFTTPIIDPDTGEDTSGFNSKSPITNVVESLTLTVSNALIGNGTFTLNDFDGIIWNTNGAALDFNEELVGQPTKGVEWGTIVSPPPGGFYDGTVEPEARYGGDFNLFDPPECVPTGVAVFTLATCSNGANFDPLDPDFQDNILKIQYLRLVSFRLVDVRPVPVPGAVFGVVAAGGLLVASRRKKKMVDAKNITNS
ncbi:MAG: hypothetical protein DCE90_09625 [Pseudanabaena sp.]|nr:MAG: hypothetical protein DCE90_09625 [Pseudanabaena sp.]